MGGLGIQNIDELPKIMPEVNWTKFWDDILAVGNKLNYNGLTQKFSSWETLENTYKESTVKFIKENKPMHARFMI
ncbi:MAG: hypothetical protein IKV41_00580 [Oscillospiraceae bacterium]|nr:hypothetical protein [Oscillospiraceae bacterium]